MCVVTCTRVSSYLKLLGIKLVYLLCFRRHVQQATGRDQSSQHKSGRPNKKRTVSIVKCSRLLSAVTWMCSPRM